MFWEKYAELCNAIGKTPTRVGKEVGVSGNAVNKWKAGSMPRAETRSRIAAYFGVSEAYLLGYTDDRSPAAPGNRKSPRPEGQEEDMADWRAEEIASLNAALLDMSPEELAVVKNHVALLKSLRKP